MTAINDVFQLRLFSTNTGTPVEMVNVFWYKLISFGALPLGSAVANELALVFNTGIVATLNNVVTTVQTYVRTETVDYGDPTDFDICGAGCGYPSTGAALGESLPPHTVWTFRYVRPFPGARNGYKRFSGPSETDVANSQATAGRLPTLDALAVSLQSQLTSPGGAVFVPVVARLPKVLGQNPLYYDVSNVEYAGVGSQVSRKRPL